MRVVYKKDFVKQFKKLSLKTQMQFYDRLKLFFENQFDPRLHNHAVDNAFRGCYSINVTGDYRSIFQKEGDMVIFLSIGTHSELYG